MSYLDLSNLITHSDLYSFKSFIVFSLMPFGASVVVSNDIFHTDAIFPAYNLLGHEALYKQGIDRM